MEEVEKKSLEIEKRILKIVALETAGSPTDTSLKWTHLKASDISKKYQKKFKDKLSNGTIKRILKANGFSKRRPNKALSTGKSPDRVEQFALIFYFTSLFLKMEHNPILSIDTKKKKIR